MTPVGTGSFDGNRITLANLAADNELRVTAECAYSRSGEGLHRFTDPVDGGVYLYTQFETSDAHRVYACFDQPDLKATFEFTVTVPAGWQVVSNMAPDVTGELTPDGTARWHFPPSPLMSTYITAIAAGPYYEVRAEHDGIPLGIYCRQSLAQYLDPDEIFEVTRQGFDFFHGAFAMRYPFGKYDQLFVPEYNAGAMENAGCVTFLEDYVFRSQVTDFRRQARATTILHEMAHMWFGDLVTMRWWDDLWLNESFATWASVLAQAEATRWTRRLDDLRPAGEGLGVPAGPAALHPPDRGGHARHRGGRGQLRRHHLRQGRRRAQAARRLRRAGQLPGRAAQLLQPARLGQRDAWRPAGAAGRGLRPGPGRLVEAVAGDRRGEHAAARVHARRGRHVRRVRDPPGGPEAHPVLRDHRIAIGLYDRTQAGLVRRRRVETDVSGERTVVAELAGETRPDLVLVNDDDLTYAKIRLDPHSMDTLLASIGEFTESLPAALCWAAAWDMCRDGELAARDYVRLVLAGIESVSVSDVSVAQTLLRQAEAAIRRYADPAWRATGLGLVADALQELLARAEPGSDVQLAYAEAFASAAITPAQLALLAGLLDGTASVAGLSIDTELRWRLLHRLVSRGAAGEAEIEAELARDATDAGERQAASCRAAVPTAAAKAVAWDLVMGGTLPNATFRAVLAGFEDRDQLALLAPFDERYFEVLPGVWRGWSSDMARWFVSYAYPMTDSTSVIAATSDFIARNDPPAWAGPLAHRGPGRGAARPALPGTGPPGGAAPAQPGQVPSADTTVARSATP